MQETLHTPRHSCVRDVCNFFRTLCISRRLWHGSIAPQAPKSKGLCERVRAFQLEAFHYHAAEPLDLRSTSCTEFLCVYFLFPRGQPSPLFLVCPMNGAFLMIMGVNLQNEYGSGSPAGDPFLFRLHSTRGRPLSPEPCERSA